MWGNLMALVYLADLTHVTITISNDSFPLNVGMVAAYAKEKHPDDTFELFKYPEDLVGAIDRKMPDMIGFSNYPWNHKLSSEIARYVKTRAPNVITVMGGPYVSYDPKEQERLMRRLDGIIDFYCMFEGESSFKALLDLAHANGFDPMRMRTADVVGSIHLDAKGNFAPFTAIPRNRDLDEFPSPYLTGTLDKFFDGKLSPMVETHRGCPFSCTFCHEGNKLYAKVNRFDTDRLLQEVEYIAERVGNRVTNLLIADPNFGQFPTDIELARKMNEMAEKHGYPRVIFATTAKNNQKNLIEIGKVLTKAFMPMWMSVQSMTEGVLENIKRRNISVDTMFKLQGQMVGSAQGTLSEVILCLPGETFHTHLKSLTELIRLGLNQINTYQLMLLHGSEMKLDDQTHNKHGFVKRYRILPRSFTELPQIGRTVEIEEIVVSTNTLSFEEYLKARQIHLIVASCYNGDSFRGFFKFVMERGIDCVEFLYAILDACQKQPGITELFADFIAETQDELFNSYEEAEDFYRQEENFKKLMAGKVGSNLLANYTCRAYLEQSPALVEAIGKALQAIAKDEDADAVEDICRYYALAFDHMFDPRRTEIVKHGRFRHDIKRWLGSKGDISDFRLPGEGAKIKFFSDPERTTFVESYFDRYGRSPQAFGKILTRLWMRDLLRSSQLVENAEATEVPIAATYLAAECPTPVLQ